MLADRELGDLVVKIHDQSFGTYGTRRVTAELRLGLGREVNHKRVERLMSERGLQGGTRRRRSKGCTRSKDTDPCSDDLVHRQFRPAGPDRLWVQDVTQHRTGEGWVTSQSSSNAWSRPCGRLVDRRSHAPRRRRDRHGHLATPPTRRRDRGQRPRIELLLVGVRTRLRRAARIDGHRRRRHGQRRRRELLHVTAMRTPRPAHLAHPAGLAQAMFHWIETFYNPTRRHSTLGHLSPIDYEATTVA